MEIFSSLIALTCIGLVGLSAGAAVWVYLPYLKDTSKYTITALCNLSVGIARAAIKVHGLPPTTKAYGSPQGLADDPEIDLMICSIRVDRHYETIVSSLRARNYFFCKWPSGKDLAEAQEMEEIAKSKGVRTMVGLQVWQSPFVNKVEEIVESGQIEKVLSTTFVGNPGFFGLNEPEFVAYTQDKKIGDQLLYALYVPLSTFNIYLNPNLICSL